MGECRGVSWGGGWIGLAALALGCGEAPEVAPGGPSVAIDVAPLELAGVTNAAYTITVFNGPNGTGEIVWTRSSLESDSYGDGAGSLSFVGPCDADTADNSVRLELEALYQGAGEAIDAATYHDPTPLTRNITCAANRDAEVVFDIAIARQAQQGFFDVAVGFRNIFCAAKLDCVVDGSNDDLDLLHNPLADGARDLTAVLGFACAGGGDDTYLFLDDPVIACSGFPGEDVTFDATALGNVDLGADSSHNAHDYLFGAAVFRGQQHLGEVAYWNISFGLNEDAFAANGSCTLTARGTATAEVLEDAGAGFTLPEGEVYPVVEWAVPLSDATHRVCGAHEIGTDEVAISYLDTAAEEATPFDHGYDRSNATLLPEVACAIADAPIVDYFFFTGTGGWFPETEVEVHTYEGLLLNDFDMRITTMMVDPVGTPPVYGVPAFGSSERQMLGDGDFQTPPAIDAMSDGGGSVAAASHEAGLGYRELLRVNGGWWPINFFSAVPLVRMFGDADLLDRLWTPTASGGGGSLFALREARLRTGTPVTVTAAFANGRFEYLLSSAPHGVCDDGYVTTVGDTCTATKACGGVACSGLNCVGRGECAWGDAGEVVSLAGMWFTVPASATEPVGICTSTKLPQTRNESGDPIGPASPVFELMPARTSFASPIEFHMQVAGPGDYRVYASYWGVGFNSHPSTRDGDVITWSDTTLLQFMLTANPCAGLSAGDTCDPSSTCAGPSTCQQSGGELYCQRSTLAAVGTSCQQRAFCDKTGACVDPCLDTTCPDGEYCTPTENDGWYEGVCAP